MLEGARGAHVCRSSTRRERVLEEEEGEAVEEATKGKRERKRERERCGVKSFEDWMEEEGGIYAWVERERERERGAREGRVRG